MEVLRRNIIFLFVAAEDFFPDGKVPISKGSRYAPKDASRRRENAKKPGNARDARQTDNHLAKRKVSFGNEIFLF